MTPETKSNIHVAVISAVVAGAISLGTAVYMNSISQQRSAQIQTVLAFSDRGFPLADSATRYIAAVTDGKPLDELRASIRAEVAQEVQASDRLRPLIKDDQAVDAYQQSLLRFTRTLDGADSPTHMRAWAEAFGAAADAHRALDKKMRAQIGV